MAPAHLARRGFTLHSGRDADLSAAKHTVWRKTVVKDSIALNSY